MEAFRREAGLILRGIAVVRPQIPAVDAKDRPTIRRGAGGGLVRKIQQAVGVPVDGRFGPGTEAAVRAFQRKHHAGLVPDGIVGPLTWAALDSRPPDGRAAHAPLPPAPAAAGQAAIDGNGLDPAAVPPSQPG
jgi:peptidoglycan hydrolase-like protein with peptidoglycan-binding domain